MHPEFQKIVDQMEPLLRTLEKSDGFIIENGIGPLPEKGVYVFYEDGKPIYVGRSNRMRARIREHAAESSRHESATFAYKLLLDAIGEPGGHSSSRTRKEIQASYSQEYQRQRQRIRRMELRAVQIENQRVQSVFEIYAIIALGTFKYNAFHTT